MPHGIYFNPSSNPIGLFQYFYRKWNKRLFGLVLKSSPNSDYAVAQDICQQVWMEIWQAVSNGTYTYVTPSLLVYRADARLKDHYRKTVRFEQLDLDAHDTEGKPDLDQRIDCKTALAGLPAIEGEVASLFFREGLTQEEIAEKLAITTRTVRRRLDHGLAHLRSFLGGNLPECSVAK